MPGDLAQALVTANLSEVSASSWLIGHMIEESWMLHVVPSVDSHVDMNQKKSTNRNSRKKDSKKK